ncbi:cytochrome P450, family 71, subfamily B, polypeptide 19 [Actinidia rufa]|uniref:Cytochrome P450, family 71, subfamily B, polypeptide 19 n=1 Tax=Actinidia rufa TaxID=165716 RepID=A0A7J0GMN4_9ERIC|nr:cytochrome P450, family 71, subfamily B, polypeptide 19 [Actinidia rufa]
MAISRIPIVDLSPFFTEGDEDAGKKEAAMEMIDEACSEYGPENSGSCCKGCQREQQRRNWAAAKEDFVQPLSPAAKEDLGQQPRRTLAAAKGGLCCQREQQRRNWAAAKEDFVQPLSPAAKEDLGQQPRRTLAAAKGGLWWKKSQIINTNCRLNPRMGEIAGAKRTITEDELENMPYLKAVIKETLRLHPLVPLVPRESTHNTQVMGYNIEARTQVFTNAWIIGRDPSLWAWPNEFWPERFMDSLVDFRGHDFEFIPFGAGRRGCPGIQFVLSVDELALANLVGNFDFSVLVGEELDTSEAAGLIVRKRTTLLAAVTPC